MQKSYIELLLLVEFTIGKKNGGDSQADVVVVFILFGGSAHHC
jgi:hypothetical protein